MGRQHLASLHSFEHSDGDGYRIVWADLRHPNSTLCGMKVHGPRRFEFSETISDLDCKNCLARLEDKILQIRAMRPQQAHRVMNGGCCIGCEMMTGKRWAGVYRVYPPLDEEAAAEVAIPQR